MLPNEAYTVCREEFEKLFSDPRDQLMVLNLRIEMLNAQLALLYDEVNEMKARRRELIKEVLGGTFDSDYLDQVIDTDSVTRYNGL